MLSKYSTTSHWIIGILSFVILFESALLIYQRFWGRFDIQHVKEIVGFTYANRLVCTVKYSTFQDIGESMLDYLGESGFMLTGLTTDTPEVESASFRHSLKTNHQNDQVITLSTEPIPPDGTSLETIQLSKTRGTFVRTFLGKGQYFGAREIFYPDEFHIVVAQKGFCV